jgi:hypothetical protein
VARGSLVDYARCVSAILQGNAHSYAAMFHAPLRVLSAGAPPPAPRCNGARLTLTAVALTRCWFLYPWHTYASACMLYCEPL